MTPTATASYSSRPMGWFARAEAWLDDKGKGAWIAAMVLGFIFFWPIGLALVFYITYTNRWSKNMFAKSCRRSTHRSHMGHMAPTGNTAFDAYREDTLRRLEEEQQNFESFLERLREAKDKAEFDQFMEERAAKAAAETKTDA
ncbi:MULTISPECIES: DUF2852 domain-containing protein [Shimia]|uniref:DUF2852 domain-containing protein n=1 Tax=Shimia TaxID=573139 RepID=UPI001FB1E24E|nr:MULTISPECIES: DUF2852 domain-containing protein [Shimia]MDV4144017.1 DUF2852 domain-containing protein [Shimia sp. FJ5]